MLTRTAQVALNASSNYLRFGVSLVVVFVLTPLMIRSLGQADFGLWNLTFSILGLLGLLDMGFLTGVVKWVAEAEGSGDLDRRNRMLSTVGTVYLLLGFVAALGAAVLSLFYVRLFAIPEGDAGKALALLWVLAARMVILNLPLSLFMGILFGGQRIGLLNLVQIVSTLLYGVTAWLVLEREMGVVALAWVNLGAMLVEHVAYVVLAFTQVPGLRLSFALADRSLLREAVSFSSAQLLINVSSLVRLRSDPILVKFFLPLSAVAVYSVALKITENALLLIKQLVNVLAPLVAQLKGEGDEQKVRFVLVNTARFVSAPALMLSVALWVLGRDAIVLWVGEEMAGAAPVLSILIAAMLLSVPPMVAGIVLAMTGHHRLTARAATVGIVINLGCSLALIGPLGLAGVALGTLIATVVADIGITLAAACRLHRISTVSYLQRVVLPLAGPGALQAGITLVLREMVPPAHLATVALEALPGMAAFLGIFWLLGVEESEKHLFATRLLRWHRQPRPEDAS